MSTQALTPIRVVGRRGGGAVTIQKFPEAASQSFKKGEAVYLVNGTVTEFTATVETNGSGAIRFLGFAAADASGVTGAEVGVYVADDDTIFEGNIYHGTVGSAVTAQTDLTALYPLKQLASQGAGMVAIDKENTANHIDCARIVGFSKKPGEAVGDTYGRVHFVIEAVGRQFFQ